MSASRVSITPIKNHLPTFSVSQWQFRNANTEIMTIFSSILHFECNWDRKQLGMRAYVSEEEKKNNKTKGRNEKIFFALILNDTLLKVGMYVFYISFHHLMSANLICVLSAGFSVFFGCDASVRRERKTFELKMRSMPLYRIYPFLFSLRTFQHLNYSYVFNWLPIWNCRLDCVTLICLYKQFVVWPFRYETKIVFGNNHQTSDWYFTKMKHVCDMNAKCLYLKSRDAT